jgi:hypothetical protein
MPEKDGLQVITDLMSRGESKPWIIVTVIWCQYGGLPHWAETSIGP